MDYPQKWWAAVDWETWERAGRPRVPRHLKLQPPPEREINPTLPPLPPGPVSSVTLFPRKRRRDADARSRALDQWLEKNIGR